MTLNDQNSAAGSQDPSQVLPDSPAAVSFPPPVILDNGNIRLYQGDCLKVMASWPECFKVGCVITDPPYGIGHKCNFASRGRAVMADCNDYPDVAGDRELYDPSPILSIGVPSILWGANHFADKLPSSSGWLVWDKHRPDLLDQSTCELAWTNCVKGVRRFSHLWHGMMRASERGENYHPTQKPVALFEWVLSLPWIPDGSILDPYMGAGPCGVAAARVGRGYIGIELEPAYFQIAVKRIQDELDKRNGDGPLMRAQQKLIPETQK